MTYTIKVENENRPCYIYLSIKNEHKGKTIEVKNSIKEIRAHDDYGMCINMAKSNLYEERVNRLLGDMDNYLEELNVIYEDELQSLSLTSDDKCYKFKINHKNFGNVYSNLKKLQSIFQESKRYFGEKTITIVSESESE